jgi:hypothetical protein
MPYSITTKDGITIQNIPDDVPADSPELKARVMKIRAQMGVKPQEAAPDPSAGGGTLQFGPIDTGIKTPEWLDRGLAGVGQAMTNTARGVGQIAGQVSRADIKESRRLDAPLNKTTAGKVGNFAGNLALLAPTSMIPGANTVTGAGVVGSLVGLTQPSESTAETIGNVALGGVGGSGGQAVANKIANVARNAVSSVTQGQKAAAAGGAPLGMRLTPGKASGSAALQKMEAALESNPMTSGGFDAIKEANQKAVNRAAAKAIGEKADELSTPILSRAEQRIGAVFDSIKDKTPVPLDPVSVGGRLNQILAESDGMLNNNATLDQNGLWRQLDKFVNDNGGATREQLRNLSSNLGKKARAEMTTQNGDRALGDALFKAQEIVEDAIEGTLSAAQKKAYAEARGQYRNLMTLTAKTNVTNPSSGNVSGRGLATTLMQKDRGGFTMGGNNSDMHAAARFTQAFPDIVGNSGTATRSMGPADYLAGIPGNLLTRMYLSEPVAKAAALGGGAAGTSAQVLNNALIRMLMQPAGVAGGLQLSNALQQ